MANGKIHFKASQVTTAALATATLLTVPINPRLTMFMVLVTIGATQAMFADPDIDHHHLDTESEKRIKKIPHIGKLLLVAWKIYWYPYASNVPHRHWLSHLPAVASLIRMIYLNTFIMPFVPVLSIWLSVWIGWTIQDAVHCSLDKAWRKTAKQFSKDIKKWRAK